ncbi:MAG: DNA methyltransferase, partial [Polyangia bacterium]
MSGHADWLALVGRDGLVIAEPVLDERFPEGPTPVNRGMHHWFRRRAERYRVARGDGDPEKQATGARQWIDFLLEDLLELPREAWRKAGDVPASCGVYLDELDQTLRADRVLVRGAEPALLVMIVRPDQRLDRKDRREGRWKASPTTKLERLLRETDHPLGLVTNGDAFRLIYAPAGLNGGHVTWTFRLLTEEKPTLDAFATLLCRDVLLPRGESDLSLADMCRLSIDRQAEVADQLGEQVRGGLEQLIRAWDAADRDAEGKLLASMTEDRIYEAGLVTMMRLVFLLYAEERDLLPHGEVLYDQGYGLTWLWHRLQEQRREAPVTMTTTRDAWDRFLATCRLVHGGCRHPDLNLLAYGGRLFDPARFPALEDPRCRVPNSTFHEVLHGLLFARQRKGGEPQRVGYWAIDVEQIGYIYEGLLDHRCARAGDVPMVKLRGAGEAAVEVTELEGKSPEDLVRLIAENTGSRPEAALKMLEREALPRDIELLNRLPAPVAERVRPLASVVQCEKVVPPFWRYLTTGTSRRASGAHYTPQSLTERIVRVTLEPLVHRNVEGKPGLLVEPREVKAPRELLGLKVCDIAMGSGAFLVQAVRYLADRLVEAWDRALAADPAAHLSMPYAEPVTDAEAQAVIDPEKRDEMVVWARRYVAERCVYGVDVNPLAVEMAALSLWLTTLAKDRPFTFLDHALKCGDSLVGVEMDQLHTWSLDRDGEGTPLLKRVAANAVNEALALRKQLEGFPVVDAADAERKAALLEKAERAMDRARLAGDLIVAPSFAEEKKAKQAELRDALLGRFIALSTEDDHARLRAEANKLLAGQRTFHWPLEFPEVFLDAANGGFDGIVGNPPYVGGQFIRRQLGERTLGWLRTRWPHSHGTADYAAFFFLRAFEELRRGGCLGLVATNTVTQGDTRESGLDRIVADGGEIYAGIARTPWQGGAAVNVSTIWVHRGEWAGKRMLDDMPADSISSALDAGGLIGKPERLAANANKSFQGSNVLGLGFALPPDEAQALIAKDPRNADVLFPYLNGKDLNTSPDQSPSRWVINFFDWPLEKAEQYPDCMKIVREKVKPERAGKSYSKAARDYWWRYERYRPELYRTIAPLERVLVCAQTSRVWTTSFVHTSLVYSHSTIVFPLDGWCDFATMQAFTHDSWREKYGPTLKTDRRYTPTDVFETFPFP